MDKPSTQRRLCCQPSTGPDCSLLSTGVPTELVRGDVFFWQSLQAATVLVAFPMPSSSICSWTGSSPDSPWVPSKLIW
jgi:hypothetical protein